MAVLVMVEMKGATTEQYDRANEILGHSSAADIPGLICHTAAVTDDGLQICDVWESADALQSFVDNQLAAALEQAGIPPAQPRVLQVHYHEHA